MYVLIGMVHTYVRVRLVVFVTMRLISEMLLHAGQVQSCDGVVSKELTHVKAQRRKMSKQEMITVNKK